MLSDEFPKKLETDLLNIFIIKKYTRINYAFNHYIY